MFNIMFTSRRFAISTTQHSAVIMAAAFAGIPHFFSDGTAGNGGAARTKEPRSDLRGGGYVPALRAVIELDRLVYAQAGVVIGAPNNGEGGGGDDEPDDPMQPEPEQMQVDLSQETAEADFPPTETMELVSPSALIQQQQLEEIRREKRKHYEEVERKGKRPKITEQHELRAAKELPLKAWMQIFAYTGNIADLMRLMSASRVFYSVLENKDLLKLILKRIARDPEFRSIANLYEEEVNLVRAGILHMIQLDSNVVILEDRVKSSVFLDVLHCVCCPACLGAFFDTVKNTMPHAAAWIIPFGMRKRPVHSWGYAYSDYQMLSIICLEEFRPDPLVMEYAMDVRNSFTLHAPSATIDTYFSILQTLHLDIEGTLHQLPQRWGHKLWSFEIVAGEFGERAVVNLQPTMIRVHIEAKGGPYARVKAPETYKVLEGVEMEKQRNIELKLKHCRFEVPRPDWLDDNQINSIEFDDVAGPVGPLNTGFERRDIHEVRTMVYRRYMMWQWPLYAQCENLVIMDFSYSGCGRWVESFNPRPGTLPNLQWVKLSGNQLTQYPRWLLDFKTGEHLHFDVSNNLIRELPFELASQKIEKLDASNNRLTKIPWCILHIEEVSLNQNLLTRLPLLGRDVQELNMMDNLLSLESFQTLPEERDECYRWWSTYESPRNPRVQELSIQRGPLRMHRVFKLSLGKIQFDSEKYDAMVVTTQGTDTIIRNLKLQIEGLQQLELSITESSTELYSSTARRVTLFDNNPYSNYFKFECPLLEELTVLGTESSFSSSWYGISITGGNILALQLGRSDNVSIRDASLNFDYPTWLDLMRTIQGNNDNLIISNCHVVTEVGQEQPVMLEKRDSGNIMMRFDGTTGLNMAMFFERLQTFPRLRYRDYNINELTLSLQNTGLSGEFPWLQGLGWELSREFARILRKKIGNMTLILSNNPNLTSLSEGMMALSSQDSVSRIVIDNTGITELPRTFYRRANYTEIVIDANQLRSIERQAAGIFEGQFAVWRVQRIPARDYHWEKSHLDRLYLLSRNVLDFRPEEQEKEEEEEEEEETTTEEEMEE
jgi:Leucine-rich repeat (LRR) protein